MNLTSIFKLLSDESRLRLIVLLAKEELCVCEICGVLEESQPKVSKILSKLRDLNLVVSNRKEKFIFYKIKDDNKVINNILNFISENIEDYPQLVKDSKRLQQKEKYLDKCSLESLQELN